MRKLPLCLGLMLLSSSLSASQTQNLVISGYDNLALGTFKGTSLLSDASIALAPEHKVLSDDLPGAVLSMEEIDSNLFWVSSMSPATLFQVSAGAEPKKIFETDRPLFTAIVKLESGQIAVTSAPHSGVHLFKDKSTTQPQFFPVNEVDLILGAAAFGSDIYLVGGGSSGGRLLKMSLPSGKVEVLAEIADSYANSLFIASSGSTPLIYFGGTSLGTVYRFSKNKVESIYAGQSAEVTSIVVDKKNRVFASFIDADGQLSVASAAALSPDDVAQQNAAKKPIKSSNVVMIENNKAAQIVWESRKTGVFSLLFDETKSQLYAGTGGSGRVLRLNLQDARTADILSESDDDGQIVAMRKRGQLLTTLAAGSGELSSIKLDSVSHSGTYYSRVIDAGNTAKFGDITVDEKSNSRFKDPQWRVGNTPTPDNTWGPFEKNPKLARYGQFKVEWPNDARAKVRQLRASYLPVNQRPIIRDARLLMPNERVQMSDPQAEWSRSVSLDENAFKIPDNRYTYAPQVAGSFSGTLSYAPNFRSAYVWAQDPDFDVLRYRFMLEKLNEQGEVKERKLLKDWDIEPFASFDTAQVGDGLYRIAVYTDDFYSNGPQRALEDTLTTPVFELTSVLPEFSGLDGRLKDAETQLRFKVEAKVPLAIVQCADARGKWFSVDPVDEVTDQRQETYDVRLHFAPKFDTITCQAMDIDQNVRKVDIKVKGK